MKWILIIAFVYYVTQIPIIAVLNATKLFVIDQIVIPLSMKVILGIVRIIRKLAAFVNRVLAQRKDSLVYLHFFTQGSYFLLSLNAKTLVTRMSVFGLYMSV